MESVLKNLLYNAVRYAKREVVLTFRRDESGYELLVEDDGPGIPESDRERVFDSFVQLERDANRKKKNYGLGLAIVKRAMEWHHGGVSIASSIVGRRSSLRHLAEVRREPSRRLGRNRILRPDPEQSRRHADFLERAH